MSSSEAYPPLLLVEDGPLTLLSTKLALEDQGFPVIAARHGTTALMALARPMRGLITDIRLPGPFNGWQIAREARERWPDIPVIYVTGEGDVDWATEGVQGSLILQKPYTASRLLATVFQLLPQQEVAHPRVAG